MRTVYHLLVLPHRPRSRIFVAALLLLSLCAGVVEVHAASERLGEDRWHAGTAPEACHPDLPAHFEPARDPEPHCPACLLRLISQGAPLGSLSLSSEILPLGASSPFVEQAVTLAVPLLPISRGPPAA